MARNDKAPAGTGASRDHLGGRSHPLNSLDTARAQFLIAAHHVRPELAAMLAAAAFGGGAV